MNTRKQQSKNKNLRMWASFLLWASIVFRLHAQTQWTQDGIFFTQSNASQIRTVPDGHGGVFTAYEDNSSGDADIYAQWIDASGTRRWGSSGVAVASAAGNQKYPAVLADGLGGAYIAWQDEVSTDLFVQHINASGTKLLAATGIAVCTETNEQTSVKMVSDGGTGAILVWADKRFGSTTDLYTQKINESGIGQWTTGGCPVTTAPQNQSAHAVLSDGSGGIFVVWQDYRNGFSNIDIYANRLNASGTQVWTSNGVVVSSATNNQLAPSAVISGNKLFVGWEDSRTGTSDIYAQALDFNGNVQWAANGLAVCSAAGSQNGSRIVEDGAGGVLLTWYDNRSATTLYDIYAQRLNSSGSPQWTANGIAVNASVNYQYAPEMVADGTGGAEIVWMDFRNGSDYDLYAQHINGSGVLLWPAAGLPVVVKPQAQQNPAVSQDGSVGIQILWQDGRNARNDVYGQSINDNITITAPASGVIWAGDRSQTVQWTYRTTQTLYHHLVMKASASPGDGFPISIASNIPPAQASQSWTPGTVNSSTVQIKIQTYNDQGRVLGEYLSPTFTVDSNPPDTFNLIAPSNGTTTDPKPAFQWQTTTDALSGLHHYELWINSSQLQDNLQTTSYALTDAQKLAIGSYTWTVKAVDKAGLIRQAGQTWSCTASDDQTPPNVFHLLTPVNNTWTPSTTPVLTWETAIDVGRGLLKYQLYVDDQLAKDDISPSTPSTLAPALTAGSHTWYVVAVDQVLNTRQSAETWALKVDNVPPAVFSLNQPSDNAWTKDNTPAFGWVASSDAGSGLTEYQLYIDGVLKMDHLPPGSTNATLPDAQLMAEGSHAWYVIAKDAAGNTRTSQSTFTVKIDVTLPQNFLLSLPANNGYVTQSSPTFSWQTASDPISGIKEYQLWLDGIFDKQGITATSSTPASPISEGSHNWTVKAVDNADNGTAASSFAFTADWTPPNTFAPVYPASGSTIHTNTPKFTWRKTTDAVSGFDKFELFLDGVLKRGNLAATDTAVTLTETLSNGNHTWKVHASDKAGNTRISSEVTFNVQCNPPAITSPSTATGTEDVLFTYTAAATDPDGDPVTITFQNVSAWLTVNGSTVRGTPAEGTLNGSFDVTASDGLFSVIKHVTVTVTPVNDPPDITSPNTASATEHQTFTYTATANDPDNPVIAFTIKNFPASWLTLSGSTLSGKPPEGAANFTFDVIASDGALKDSIRVSVTVTPVNDPPVFSSAGQIYATEDIEFSYTAAAADPEGAVITFGFKNVPFWMTPSGNKISGTPTEGILSGSFDVTASDGSMTTTLHVTVNVNPVNDPPIITSPISAAAIEDQAFSYTVTAFDPEGSPLTYTYSNYSAWLTPSGNTIGGTPGEGITGGMFNATVSDGSLSTTLHVTLTVTAVNDPPVITSPASANGTEGILFTYTAQATDPDGDALTTTFQNVPSWLHVSGQTLSGTPREGTLTGSFVLSITDGAFTRSQTVNITIQPVNDAPVITSPAVAAATEDILFTYTAAAYDSEGDPLTYSFQNMSSWLLASGKTISGTPGEGITSGTFGLTVSDGKLSTTRQVAVTVTPVNDPPNFTSSNSAAGTEDVPFMYTAAATDPEGTPIVYSFMNYPPWLTPNGNRISGTPGEGILNGAFDVIASDGVLSSTLHVSVAITPVNDPPKITSSDKTTGTEDILFMYSANATDPEGSPISYIFKNYPTWLMPNGNTISGTPREGVLSGVFDVIASDGSLYDTVRVTMIVTPVNDPPQFTSANTATGTEDLLFTYTPTATDPEGIPVTFAFQNYPTWLSVSGQTITGTPTEGILSGYFDVTAGDGSLTTPLRVTITVTPVNDPPVITSPTSVVATEHALFSYMPTITDPDNSTFTYTYQNYSVWLKPDGSRISGTPGEGVLNGAFDITVSDGQLTDTKRVTISVTPVNDPPYFTSKDTASATEDKPFSYTARAADPEGSPVSFTFFNAPSWLKASGNQIGGTPGEANHDTTFRVIASDGSLKDTLKISIHVKQVNDKPKVTSPAAAEARENSPFSYTAAMTDPDGPRESIRFSDYPDWLSPVGKLIGGVPPHNAVSTTFKVIAWDGDLSDTLVVHLTVVSVNDPPYFDMAFPKPTLQPQPQLRWQLYLDDYIVDPDNPDSSLTWSSAILDTQRVGVSIIPRSHIATITGFNVQRDIRIVFTVTDPSGASASDTLTIAIKRYSAVATRFSDDIPADYTLSDNFPNPFNPATVIRYGLPRTSHVIIEIYNLMGQKVAGLINEKQQEGYYEIQWNAARCPSGVYLCRIQAGAWQKMKKLSLVK